MAKFYWLAIVMVIIFCVITCMECGGVCGKGTVIEINFFLLKLNGIFLIIINAFRTEERVKPRTRLA